MQPRSRKWIWKARKPVKKTPKKTIISDELILDKEKRFIDDRIIDRIIISMKTFSVGAGMHYRIETPEGTKEASDANHAFFCYRELTD